MQTNHMKMLVEIVYQEKKRKIRKKKKESEKGTPGIRVLLLVMYSL